MNRHTFQNFVSDVFVVLAAVCIVCAASIKSNFDGWISFEVAFIGGFVACALLAWIVKHPRKCKLYITAAFKATYLTIKEKFHR